MEYTENEMLNKDIDWFIRVRSELIHVASAGTFLPKIIQYAKEDNEERFKFILKQQDCYSNIDVEINPLLRDILHIEEYVDEYSLVLEALNIPLGNDIINTYLDNLYIPAFSKYARKGFISFDSTGINDNNSQLFHWVARPKSNIAKDLKLYSNKNLPLLTGEDDKCSNLISILRTSDSPIPLVDLIDKLDIN